MDSSVLYWASKSRFRDEESIVVYDGGGSVLLILVWEVEFCALMNHPVSFQEANRGYRAFCICTAVSYNGTFEADLFFFLSDYLCLPAC